MKSTRFATTFLLCFFSASLGVCRTTVQFDTTLGSFQVELFDDLAPRTVENFLRYVDDGDYTDSILHRSVPDFVIQGGGFTTTAGGDVVSIPLDEAIQHEDSGLSNLRGTLGLARNILEPDSGQAQWFINTADNPFLDTQGEVGFTIFGVVVANGLEVVDALNDLPTIQATGLSPSFFNLPVVGSFAGNPAPENLVTLSITRVPEPGSLLIAATLGATGGLVLRRRRVCYG